MLPRPHRRQFVLGPERVQPVPEWIAREVPGAGWLSHCPELRVHSASTRDGTPFLLLGRAVATADGEPAPADAIATAADADSLLSRTDGWAGRWVLIGGRRLHLDATGLLGCYVRQQPGRARGTETWVSSSAVLLAPPAASGDPGGAIRPIVFERGLDWYPLPRSGVHGVRRLLPSQVLDLDSGAVLPRTLVPAPATPLSFEDYLEGAEGFLTCGLRRVAGLAGDLWLPLTGGYDSRLLLAAAVRARIPVRAYTFVHRQMTAADRALPVALAERVGVPHFLVTGVEADPAIAALVDRHTGRQHVGRDREYLARRFFRWARPGDVILRGGAISIGKMGYHKGLAASDPTWMPPPAASILAQRRHPTDPWVAAALQEWIAWCAQHSERALDWRDRFGLEQRLGGWLSAQEQMLDLLDAECFQLGNSRRYAQLALFGATERRRGNGHAAELIRRLEPRFANVPLNPPPPMLQRVRLVLSRRLRVLRARLGGA